MGARYAYLCPPRWAGGWRVTIGVPLSESIQVRVGVLRLGGEAAVRVRTRRVRGLGALVEWVGPQRLPRRPVGWRRIPCRRGSQKLLRRPPGGGRCAPALRSGPPGRGPAERTQRHRPPLGRRARSLTPRPGPGAGSRRRPAGRTGGWATSTCIRTRGGTRSAWRPPPGCCTKKAVGHAIGARGTSPGVRGDRHGGPQAPDEKRRYSTPTWGAGRRARSTRSTEQQDKQPETQLSRLSETRLAAHALYLPENWRVIHGV